MLVHCLNLYLSHTAVAKEQQCSVHLSCMHINRRVSRANREGAKSFWKRSGLQILWTDRSNLDLQSLFRAKFSIKQTRFPAQHLEENTLCCITAYKLWNDSDPREKHISCSSWFRKTLYTPSPLAAGVGPRTLIVYLLHLLLCCIWRLQWEYSYWSKFNTWFSFFLPSNFHLWWKIFHFWWKTEGCHITICFLSLARGMKQTYPSHFSGPLENITLIFRTGLQPSSIPFLRLEFMATCVLTDPYKKKTTPKPQHLGLLTHWTNRD